MMAFMILPAGVSSACSVTDVHEPPQFDTSAIELEVDENTSTNTNVGSPIPALDPESDELTYSQVGSDAQWFDVDTSSGQIKTKALLGHESPGASATGGSGCEPAAPVRPIGRLTPATCQPDAECWLLLPDHG